MSKLRAHKPAHTKNPRQKAVIQPPWWNKETQAAWTDKQTMVKSWKKERSKPHPDLTIKARMEEKTEVFKRVANEARDRQWKSFCDTQHRHNTHSLLVILPTDRGLRCKCHTYTKLPPINRWRLCLWYGWIKTARSPDSVVSIVIRNPLPYLHFKVAATG